MVVKGCVDSESMDRNSDFKFFRRLLVTLFNTVIPVMESGGQVGAVRLFLIIERGVSLGLLVR